jgi:hypothetical protein
VFAYNRANSIRNGWGNLTTRKSEYLLGCAQIAFPLMAMIVNMMLIVFRLRDVQGADAVLPYLIGGRYLIFPSFYLFMMGVALFPLLIRGVALWGWHYL